MDKLLLADIPYKGLTKDQIDDIQDDHVLKQYDILREIRKSLLSRNKQLLNGKNKPRMEKKQVQKKLYLMFKKETCGTKENEGTYKIFRKIEKDLALHNQNILNIKNPFDRSNKILAMDDICIDRRLINDLGVFSGILYKKRRRYFREYKNLKD
jgi:hypothetical protein